MSDDRHTHTPDYDRLLTPTPAELALLLSGELYDTCRWVLRFNLTRTIARLLGRDFDPAGSRLPEWKRTSPSAPPAPGDDIIIHAGGFPVGFDGAIIRSEDTTRAIATAAKTVASQVEISPEEWQEMKTYNPPLLNVALARKIKTCWQQGKTDHEASVLAGCSLSYARHYRLAFEKASRRTDPLPYFTGGGGPENPFKPVQKF